MNVVARRDKVASYERSMRPFSDLLKIWRVQMGLTRAGGAETLGVRLATFNEWCDGRSCGQELAIRKLMDLLIERKGKC